MWLYFRFCLSYRDVEELMAERGVTLTYEAVRYWCRKFGQTYANALRRRRPRPGDKWHLDEVFLTINGAKLAITSWLIVSFGALQRSRGMTWYHMRLCPIPFTPQSVLYSRPHVGSASWRLMLQMSRCGSGSRRKRPPCQSTRRRNGGLADPPVGVVTRAAAVESPDVRRVYS